MLSRDSSEHEKLEDYLTVGKAARFLGVSAETLRNWDRSGKLRAYRHPINRYRLYRRAELETLLSEIRGLDPDGD
jgi:MerR family copper efflux transcriptional regulator